MISGQPLAQDDGLSRREGRGQHGGESAEREDDVPRSDGYRPDSGNCQQRAEYSSETQALQSLGGRQQKRGQRGYGEDDDRDTGGDSHQSPVHQRVRDREGQRAVYGIERELTATRPSQSLCESDDDEQRGCAPEPESRTPKWRQLAIA